MKKLTYFKLILVSITGALLLSFLSLYCLVRISELVVDDYRYGYLLYMAKKVEKAVISRPIEKVNIVKYLVPPEVPNETLSLMEASTEFGSPDVARHGNSEQPGPDLWIVSEKGKVLSSNVIHKNLPLNWTAFILPKKIHAVESNRIGLLSSKSFIMKLETSPVSYLISHNPKSLFHGPFLWVQGIHTFLTAAATVFLALTISFFYLQRKSAKARKVMARLESGDLKARFEIKRFDQFGNLIVDFNRMAEKIESLVEKIRHAESSRSQLLQELGHDVRTPLTSLRTTFDTLRDFEGMLSAEERKDIFQMLESDISYFQELLDKLTIVATIDSPRYRKNTTAVMLDEILLEEINNRKTASHLNWKFSNEGFGPSLILGDSHLVLRLFKNAFDNASRYAREAVTVSLVSNKDGIEVQIKDDGPGVSEDAIKSFGKRRERRKIKDSQSGHFSLGLGSVIMKAIAEVHHGKVLIENRDDMNGACLRVIFRHT